jgi:hypothetical protein
MQIAVKKSEGFFETNEGVSINGFNTGGVHTMVRLQKPMVYSVQKIYINVYILSNLKKNEPLLQIPW